ncbi:MAG TPA: hypothetical protein VGM88_02380 [Kofleriaceae bacterium]|jgi:hypothetical protein
MKKLIILLGLVSTAMTGCIIRERHPHHATIVVHEHDHYHHY